MTATKITDHAAQALGNMSTWTTELDRLRKLVELFGDQVQLLEDVVWQVVQNSLLDNATGEILDEYGGIFDELRGALDDDDYRKVLSVVIGAYQSDGTVPEVIYLASTLLGVPVKYQQYQPAHYRLEYEIDYPVAADWQQRVLRVLDVLRPAGVDFSLVEGSSSGAFQFDDGPGFDQGFWARRVDGWILGSQILPDGDFEDGPGPELLVDGDMEAAGIGAWSVGAGTASKQGNAYEGDQCLRVEQTSGAPAFVSQSIFTIGQTVEIVGVARGDGTAIPSVRNPSGTVIWQGTASTVWQPYSFMHTPSTSASYFLLSEGGSSGNYAEFDANSVKAAAPAWTAINAAEITKEITDPFEGLQCLRVAYDGTTNPAATQTGLSIGAQYLIVGRARSDGTAIPRVKTGDSSIVWTGTTDTDWQPVVVTGYTTNARFDLQALASAAGYCEFDKFVIYAL